MELPEADRERIQQAIYDGRKIEAIKLWRESTGTGLAEAKLAVEAIESELRSLFPERFTARPTRAGCTTLLLTILASALAAGAVALL